MKETPGRFRCSKHLQASVFQRRPRLAAKIPFSWKSNVIIVDLMKNKQRGDLSLDSEVVISNFCPKTNIFIIDFLVCNFLINSVTF